jgi:Fe-S cluster assembly protein SufD
VDQPTLTPDVARTLPGPAWLAARRAAHAERAAGMELPSTEEEIWRYSRIAELDLGRFAFASTHTSVQGADDLVGEPTEADPEAPCPDLFAEWNAAFAEPLVLRVPRGHVVPTTIVVTHDADDGGVVFPRLVIHAAADCELTVVERFRSAPDALALVAPVLELRAGPGARVRYVAVNELGRRTWQIGHQLAWAERDATVVLATVALGGDYARVRTEAVACGQGSTTRQTALYFADGTQMHDFRTIQSHEAPRSDSNLLFKGAVKDTARSVYTGLIRIGHEAKGSSAFQTNRSLTLSEGAWAESVPNLDILTNDVRCSHASTVGPIDPDQRFYLESRGVPPEVGERLIVLGFFDEVLEQLPATDLAQQLRARVAAKLDGVAA